MKAFFGEQARVLAQFLIAYTSDACGDVKKLRSKKTNRHVGFIVGGNRKDHVGIVGTSALQYGRREGISGHPAQIQTSFERIDPFGIVIHDRDVVGFIDEVFGNRPSDAAGTDDEDMHKLPLA